LITPPEGQTAAAERRETAAEGTAKDLLNKSVADGTKAAGLYTPKQREKNPAKLTVDQYLKQASLKEDIGGLVRSMYGTKIMALKEWENTVTALLKRPVR
jgi:hypothetical protein